jgi:hypothetical protein
MVKSVDSLPNIDAQLAADLEAIGINTAEDLVRDGAGKVWRRLVDEGLCHDIQSLLILEGAVEGVNWSQIPFDRRQELSLEAVSYSQGERAAVA